MVCVVVILNVKAIRMKNVLISGGSGLIGRRLTQLLMDNGYAVAWLSRGNKAPKGVKVFNWDINKGFIDPEAITWANMLVHLAGEGIAEKRWSKKRKSEIIESRTAGANMLIKVMQENPGHIKTVVAASAIGFYGNTGNVAVHETDNAGEGFLSESVQIWEKATHQFELAGARLVQLRIGIVLSMDGGALKEIVQTAPMRILPVMGSGKQIYSWIHIDDVAGIIFYALNNPIGGVFNAVAPNPVTQKNILIAFRKAAHKQYLLMPVPTFGLKLVFGEMSSAVLNNQLVSADKIITAGYKFHFPEIENAMNNLLHE